MGQISESPHYSNGTRIIPESDLAWKKSDKVSFTLESVIVFIYQHSDEKM